MAKVIVVGFQLSDIEAEEKLVRPVKATRAKLASMRGAEEIPATEESVEETLLVSNGFYHPEP